MGLINEKHSKNNARKLRRKLMADNSSMGFDDRRFGKRDQIMGDLVMW